MSTSNYSIEVKVGVFTILGIIAMIFIFMFLSGNPFGRQSQNFYTISENVQGIGKRTQVRTSGVNVGEVTSVDILKNGARINFTVESQISIPLGSTIEIKSRGLLGDVYLEIDRNDMNPLGDYFKPGDMIPLAKNVANMSDLMNNLGQVSQDIKKVSETLADVFGNKDAKQSLTNILQNIESFTVSAQKSAEKLNNIIANNESKLDDIFKNAKLAANNFRQLSGYLKSILNEENRDKIQSIIDEMESSAENIEGASDKINKIIARVERGQGTLGQLLMKDETAEEIKQTIKDVQELIEPALNLKVKINYRGEYAFSHSSERLNNFGNQISLVLSTRPERYYILGVSSSSYARKASTTTTTITKSPNNTFSEEKVEVTPEDIGSLRFNAQIGTRFSFVGLRFGIIDSHAGLGADFYFLNGRLVGSLEASHFITPSLNRAMHYDKNYGFVRLKAYANLFLTNHLFVTGGLDEIIRNKVPLPFVGAGISFSDQDIKAVIGTAAVSAKP